MRVTLLTFGLFVMAGCAETSLDPATTKAASVGIEQGVVGKLPDDAEIGPHRVVVLPRSDVIIGNVSVYNGGYPIANTLAQEECGKRRGYAVRVSERTPDGLVQFNCAPPGRAY